MQLVIVESPAKAKTIEKYLGSGYLHDGNDYKGQLSVTFVPDLPAAGEYEVRSPGGTSVLVVDPTVMAAGVDALLATLPGR